MVGAAGRKPLASRLPALVRGVGGVGDDGLGLGDAVRALREVLLKSLGGVYFAAGKIAVGAAHRQALGRFVSLLLGLRRAVAHGLAHGLAHGVAHALAHALARSRQRAAQRRVARRPPVERA